MKKNPKCRLGQERWSSDPFGGIQRINHRKFSSWVSENQRRWWSSLSLSSLFFFPFSVFLLFPVLNQLILVYLYGSEFECGITILPLKYSLSLNVELLYYPLIFLLDFQALIEDDQSHSCITFIYEYLIEVFLGNIICHFHDFIFTIYVAFWFTKINGTVSFTYLGN